MDFDSVKVIVGKSVYTPTSFEFTQEVGQYPSLEINAMLHPCMISNKFTLDQNLSITNVIFNPPATIVFWSDKTKTVVKCDYEFEPYDPEKGIAMAISRKMLGNNKREYYNTFKHWLKKWDKQKYDQCKTPEPAKDKNAEWEWDGGMYDA